MEGYSSFFFQSFIIFSVIVSAFSHVTFQPPSVKTALPIEDGMDTADFWRKDAQQTIKNKMIDLNKNRAKNVILFLGDGMSIETITAARILSGQLKGKLGERSHLSFEKFPSVGLSKTYCVDKQVSDSACTATSYLCGIKGNFFTIGVTANVSFNDCVAAQDSINQAESIASWAQKSNKATGFVTTTTVTNASPAGLYAHTSNRLHESDYDVKLQGQDSNICKDVALQLVTNKVGKNLNIILGGGIKKFLPNETSDANGNTGERLDGRNLINEWMNEKKGVVRTIFNRSQLLSLDLKTTDYLLGLFSDSHMNYKTDADDTKEPTLAEMTEVAIKILQKNNNGFFLFVEGGLIDHGHHETKAQKALMETVEFSEAIQKALDITDNEDTLIVVTADHGHTMSMVGYPTIGNNILGLNTHVSSDGLPITTLSYANGPGFYKYLQNEKVRLNLSTVNVLDKDFLYPSTFPEKYESHGGEDVAVFAYGPWSHLFSGVYEQSALPHMMAYASCIGDSEKMCSNSASLLQFSKSFLFCSAIIYFLNWI